MLKDIDDADIQKLIKIARELHLQQKLIQSIQRYGESREWQKAIELLCNVIRTERLSIGNLEYRIVTNLGSKLGIDSELWKDITLHEVRTEKLGDVSIIKAGKYAPIKHRKW